MVARTDHAQRAEHFEARTTSIRTVFVGDVLGEPARIEHEISMSRPDRKIVGTTAQRVATTPTRLGTAPFTMRSPMRQPVSSAHEEDSS